MPELEVPALEDADRSSFEQNGLLVIDPGFDPALLDRVLAEVAPILAAGEGAGDLAYSAARAMNAWKQSPAVRELARAPQVLAILRELFGREPKPFQTLNFPVGTEQRIHSDTIHFNSDPAGLMCGVWVALEDTDADNGPLTYYPGSHKLPELTMEDAEARGFYRRDLRDRAITTLLELGAPLSKRHWFVDGNVYPLYEDMIADEIARRSLVPAQVHIRRGQAVVWAANLLHGGSARRDRSRTRHSQVTHYFFEGATTYTPLRSHGRYRFYRNPDWIE